MRRMKPTEVRAIADMLQEPAEDADELARMILRRINEMRDREGVWVMQVFDVESRRIQAMWGPYQSAQQARRAVEEGRVLSISKGESRASLWRLVDSETADLGDVEE